MVRKKYEFDYEFQVKILMLVLREPTFLPRYSNCLSPDYFDDDYLATVIGIVLNYYENESSNQIPIAEVTRSLILKHAREMDRDDEWLSTCLEVVRQCYNADLTGVEQVVPMVVEFGRARQMETMLTTASMALTNGVKSDEIWVGIDQFRNKSAYAKSDEMDLGKDLFEIDSLLEASVLYDPRKKIPLGIPSLDQAFSGGLGRREVAMVIGSTGRGKSTFLVNIGANAVLTNHSVVHFAVNELENIDLAVRYASRLTGFPISSIVSRTAGTAYREKLTEVTKGLGMNLISHHIPMYTPVSSLRSFLSRFKYQKGLDPELVIIDNTDDLSSSRKERDGYIEKGAVYSELKSLAHDFDVAIWCDSQSNRMGGSEKVVQIHHIAESYKKTHKADVILTMSQNDEEYEAGQCRLKVEKARRSRRVGGVLNCMIDTDRMLIREALSTPAVSNG